MGGAGNIPWGDVQEFMDREGLVDPVMRESVERLVYRIDQAMQSEVSRMAANDREQRKGPKGA